MGNDEREREPEVSNLGRCRQVPMTTVEKTVTLALPSAGRRAGYFVARNLFPPKAARSRPVRRLMLRRVLRHLAATLEETPMAGKLWLMGGIAIGYERAGRALDNDLTDVDLGYADVDHEAMMLALPHLVANGFALLHRLEDNAGTQTIMRLRRDGVWFDLVRCFRRDDKEYWITYAIDRSTSLTPLEVEVETEVAFQDKIPTVPPLYGTMWLRAADLPSYLDEQYGEKWRAPDRVFYAAQWDHVRDSPAVVRVEPWEGTW